MLHGKVCFPSKCPITIQVTLQRLLLWAPLLTESVLGDSALTHNRLGRATAGRAGAAGLTAIRVLLFTSRIWDAMVDDRGEGSLNR